jgi:AraC family transcriptional activator of pobA
MFGAGMAVARRRNGTDAVAPRDTVPVFSLYGESHDSSDLEFIHIEDIRSRSERYAWEISPHLHKGLFQALFVFDGGAEAILDGEAETAGPGSVVVVPPGVVHAFRFEPDTSGFVLTLAETLPLRLADQRSRGLFDALSTRATILHLGAEASRASALLDQIAIELRMLEPGHGLIGEWLVAAVLMLVARHDPGAGGRPSPDHRSIALFATFRRLVEDHFRDHWPIGLYAKALSISETRLDRLCRALASKSAFEFVQDRLLLETRRKLVHVAAPVSMIAYELGFEDPAYFCRFFRKRTGMTPSAFRKAQRARLSESGAD